jgi:hypothetical protein
VFLSGMSSANRPRTMCINSVCLSMVHQKPTRCHSGLLMRHSGSVKMPLRPVQVKCHSGLSKVPLRQNRFNSQTSETTPMRSLYRRKGSNIMNMQSRSIVLALYTNPEDKGDQLYKHYRLSSLVRAGAGNHCLPNSHFYCYLYTTQSGDLLSAL